MANINILDKVEEIRKLRRQELDAAAKRHKLEAEISAALQPPLDGSKTEKIGDYKVTCSAKLKRVVDWEALDAADLSDVHRETITRLTRTLDLKNLKIYQTANPAVYNKIAACITATPAKVTVTIK